MSNERNALAELADKMIESRNILVEEGWLGCGKAVFKAKLIISELAKVGFLKTVDGELVAHPGDACEAIDKCRAIAEE